MAFTIPEQTIANIRNNTDIIRVISETVQLKKTGRNFVGLCPFHSEKTPSFTATPEKQIFYCFGCGTGGDVFSFIMKRDSIPFPEAVTLLGKQCGISTESNTMTYAEKQAASEREQLFAINELAKNYFSYTLNNTSAGMSAKNYLVKRGLSPETINTFAIGYVPDGWQNLTTILQKKGFSQEIAVKSGLVIAKNQRLYDRFRNRIIFPIFTISNTIAGFGGRVMDDALPKYLNSPETPVYNKSKTLFGFNVSRLECRQTESVYIVEGYFDMVALYQHGIKNVVATLGTALTRDHVRTLSRSGAKRFILVFDSDTAGIKAAKRSIPVFQDEYLSTNILILPRGYDPDSYIFEFGADAFNTKAADAMAPLPFLLRESMKQHGTSIEGKLRTINDIIPPLADVEDPMARSLYIKEIADFTGIEENAIHEKLKGFKQTGHQRQTRPDTRFAEQQRLAPQMTGKWSGMEKQIIAMMYQFPDIIRECQQTGVLDFFENPELKSLGHMAQNYQGDYTNMLSDLLNQADSDRIKQQIAALGIGTVPWVYNDCLKLINQFISNRMKSMDTLSHQIREAEKNNDYDLLTKLMNKKILFSKALKAKQISATRVNTKMNAHY